ncbi:MAG: cysteine synthase family protein, partial [Verrucomicrobia bacterium]|nr:cysteine synthase family protein [Verrucomicrobiota bacterium]
NTPLIELQSQSSPSGARLFAKLEMYNPTRSIKDRIALHMIKEAERKGVLRPGMHIVDPSSGNTGASLALVGIARGYSVTITVPEKTSPEKIALMQAYGATIRVCPGKKSADPDHYVTYAKTLLKEIPSAVMLDQYNNPANIEAHYQGTGPEIWSQLDGKIDYLVACSSSGGTVTGVARYLKSKNPNLQIVVPDPIGSIYYDYFTTKRINLKLVKPYITQGAGNDHLCSCVDFSVIDAMVQFSDENMLWGVNTLLQKERLLVGETAGAAFYVAHKLAQTVKSPANIVVIFPDGGEKYLSVYSL